MPELMAYAQIHHQDLPRGERRTAERFPCAVEGGGKPFLSHGRPAPVQLRDISQQGFSLRVKQPFDLGALVSVELHDKNAKCLRKLVRVVNVRRDDDDWVLGCSFLVQLGGGELRELL
jgi:hypothetical protein